MAGAWTPRHDELPRRQSAPRHAAPTRKQILPECKSILVLATPYSPSLRRQRARGEVGPPTYARGDRLPRGPPCPDEGTRSIY
ncbi:MAG: hypothetical protein MZV64_32980 [Ignavibacteriales bacterium]|nr:hypothetical protein [Ignavibacteriales bacterium]